MGRPKPMVTERILFELNLSEKMFEGIVERSGVNNSEKETRVDKRVQKSECTFYMYEIIKEQNQQTLKMQIYKNLKAI